jgi:hypothetical protein
VIKFSLSIKPRIGGKRFVLILSKRYVAGISIVLIICLLSSTVYADGELQTIRDDVRGAPPAENPPDSNPPEKEKSKKTTEQECYQPDQPYCPPSHDYDVPREYGFTNLAISAAGYVAAAPVTVPRLCLRDDRLDKGYFSSFPYDLDTGYMINNALMSQPVVAADQMAGQKFVTSPKSQDLSIYQSPDKPPDAAQPEGSSLAPGYMTIMPSPTGKTWSCQVQADYLDNFDSLNGIYGQLLIETAPRIGVQTSVHAFWENLGDNRFDHLTLGDCNLIYRFAQHPRGQMRMGIGANWMTDPAQTDLGFNFTYGGDFFPCKPLVFSTKIDWGTLGHAGLFRFRTTTGLTFRNFEPYIGYEYSDIGTTQDNFFISGVRIWF